MTQQPELVPFLLRFAEEGTEPDLVIDVFYDHHLGLNVLQLPDGTCVPAVQELAAGTSTLTEVRAERTDTDPQDDQAAAAFDPTATGTRVQTENTDEDRENSALEPAGLGRMNHWTFLGKAGPDTTTFTKIKTETTDRD